MNPVVSLLSLPQPMTPTATGTHENAETSRFSAILGGLLEEATAHGNESISETEIDALIDALKRAGISIDEEALTDEDVVDFLQLLPLEWREDVYDLAEDVPVPWNERSVVEKVLVALIALQTSQEIVANPVMKQLTQQLNKYVTHLMPQLVVTNGEAVSLKEVTRVLRQLLAKFPHSRENVESFVALFTKEDRAHPSTNRLPALMNNSGPNFKAFDLKLTLPRQVHETIPSDRGQGLFVQEGQELGQYMHRAEQAVIQLGERLPKRVQEQQFVRQFQQILQRAVFTNRNGIQTLSLKLYPEHLGRVDVQLIQQDGAIVAKILTSHATAKEWIESQIVSLRQAFLQQQIPVERVEVAEQFIRDDHPKEKHEREQEPEKRKRDDEFSFEDVLEQSRFDEEV